MKTRTTARLTAAEIRDNSPKWREFKRDGQRIILAAQRQKALEKMAGIKEKTP